VTSGEFGPTSDPLSPQKQYVALALDMLWIAANSKESTLEKSTRHTIFFFTKGDTYLVIHL
jgi:hypothetical protein